MSADWNTKYGTRRVRHDPPTLDEAIFAAVGITDDQDQQAEIASSSVGGSWRTRRVPYLVFQSALMVASCRSGDT